MLLLATLVGCSRTDLVYSNADWLLQRWAADLLNPEPEQRDAWREVMKQAMQLHRRDLLPDVVRILRTAEVAAAGGLDRRELSCWTGLVEEAYLAHANWTVAPAAEVLGGVSSAQIEYLAEELRDRNRAYRDDYMDEDPVERQEARVARYVERIERWIGDLSAGQRRLVEEAVSAMPDVAEGWLDYREEQQQSLLRLLRAGADRVALESFLTAWWVDLDGRPAALVKDSETLSRATLDLVLRLDATLSTEQRTTFLEQLADLREDLARLSGQEGKPLPVQGAKLACIGAPQPVGH
jgi:hypothetical protein